jgi:hypothetical protein
MLMRLLVSRESATDEVTQVECGGSAGEPGVVLLGAAVAQFQATTTEAGDFAAPGGQAARDAMDQAATELSTPRAEAPDPTGEAPRLRTVDQP